MNENVKNHPLRSVHTNTMVDILNRLGISLLVTTYQAGKLIAVRSESNIVNTHFKIFDKPMGMAKSQDGFALGSGSAIWEFRNIPTAAEQIEGKLKHDACFVPKNIHVTGDIDIHEMEFVNNELWFINTKFSCLCTKDDLNSFTPRWKPPFITGYDMTDRCHLNGFCSRDGRPKYVTSLGESDKAMGWRENKAFGGTLMDIETNEILARGLSMPHSPRWYQNRLWVLESGRGSLGYYDFQTKEVKTVATLPGFTRGIDFYGDLAFIGLSKVRESAVFSGIPLTQQVSERICGVWIVNIRSGEILGFLRFEEGVEEIFAVSVLPNTRYPEIIEYNQPVMHSSYVLPEDAVKLVSSENSELEVALPYFEDGNQLYNEGRKEEAIEKYRKALEIQPDYIPAKYNLGVTLGDLDRYKEAEIILREVIKADAGHAEALNSLGFILNKQGDFAEAIKHYRKAIKIRPKYAQPHFNLGMVLLLKEEYQQGWEEYEWRFLTPQFNALSKNHKMWEGEDISDKTLLLHTEQGAGDAIMMARYIPEVKKRCKKLILVCTENLQPLFEQFPEIDEIKNAGTFPNDSFDVFCPIMSLPKVLALYSNKLSQNNYLKADIKSVLLKKQGNKLRVGLVWAGNKSHASDHLRSLELKEFDKLLQLPDIQWFSLQKGEASADIADGGYENKIENIEEKITNYGDTASIIGQLDLVIGVDTSVVHLSGALGVKTWTLVPKVPDWRWGLNGNQTEWYPTMELFRQKADEDCFQSVIFEMQRRLEEKDL